MSLRPLVITPTLPPTTGQDASGVYKRLALFLEAIGDGGRRRVRVIRLVPRGIKQAWEGLGRRLDEIESAFWGQDVSITLVPRRTRSETFYTHYIQGIVDIASQPAFFPFGGEGVVKEIARQLDATTDLVFVHRLPAMCAFLQTHLRPPRVYFDLDDVEHRMRFRESLVPPIAPGKLLYTLHLPALIDAERRGAGLARATFVCSERDRRHMARLRAPNVVVVPNAVSAPCAMLPPPPEPTILLLGTMTYGPNVEAAQRLVKNIMPLIWLTIPAAHLLIAGPGSDTLPLDGPPNGRVTCLGFVQDLAALYARTRVVCSPLLNGGGTRIKLVEAGSYGKAMVSTRVGAEGLAFVDGEEIVLAETDGDLAAACVVLLQDEKKCLRLGTAARHKMMQLYDRKTIVAGIKGLMAADREP